jgi:hypothetical protein
MPLPPISRRIIEFAGDDLPPLEDVDGYMKALRFAQMAWNYSILPPDSDAAKAVDDGLLRMPAVIRASIQSRLLEWMERKRRMFPDDRRIIVELRLKDRRGRHIVEAASYDYDNPKRMLA